MSLNYKSVLFIFVVSVLPLASVSANALKGHTSPYLAMHGNDPVNWREWNAQTVALAQKQGKLLFVSSGYFSCHWCHVMQRESFQNQDIANLVNKHFIAVKVDRELDTALDAQLIDFVERTQGNAGWPLNVFVTPAGYPLVGMVYVPAENFKQILQKLNDEWGKDAASLQRIAKNASAELSAAVTTQNTQLPTELAKDLLQAFNQQVLSYADTMQGGFGQQNKFPSVPQLMTLLEIYSRKPEPANRDFLLLTLNQMASHGLRDQLAGGFFRYAVDPGWQVPHFEKMLYDNALLASLYYRAGKVFDAPEFIHIANDTLDFILRDLATQTHAYAASLSAVDDKGIEGGYYLWDVASLKKLLNKEELATVSLLWHLSGAPDLDDGHHLVQAMSTASLASQLNISEAKVKENIATASRKMRAARGNRVLPKDSKILSAWNGLTLTALVNGANTSANPRYQQKAKQLAQYIQTQLWDSNKQILYKAASEKQALGPGALEDYAYVAQGLYTLLQMDNNPQTQAVLTSVIEQAWQRFYGKQGWQLAQDMLLKYGTGKTLLSDGAMPSASAVLIKTTYQYGMRSKNQQFIQNALRAMNVGHAELRKDAFWFASQIDAIRSAQALN